MPARAPAILLLTALTTLAMLVGCTTTRPHTAESSPRSVPNDFAFSVAIPRGLEMTALYPEQVDLLARPAWYMVEPDATLRASLGQPRMDGPVPPRVRRLSTAQRAQLFALLDSRGALTPWSRSSVGMGIPVGDASEVVSGEDGAPAVGVWWSAFGRSRSFAVLPAAMGSDGEPAWQTVRDAVALLEKWSWIATDPASGLTTTTPTP